MQFRTPFSVLAVSLSLFGAQVSAQGSRITIPNGNNISQVTNPTTGVTYAINKVSSTDVQLVVIQPNGTFTTQQFTLPSGYQLRGRSAKIDLDANGAVSLGVTDIGTSQLKVAQYLNFNVTAPVLHATNSASVFAASQSGRFVGVSGGLAGEFLPGGGFAAAPGQLDGTAYTAWEGASGFGYAGSLTKPSTFRFESFIYENGVVSDPFNSLNYESAFVGACSSLGMFCFGNVTDAVAGEQMYMVDRMTGALTGFVDEFGSNFYASYFAGAREDGWVFGNGGSGIWAANQSIWGNVVRPFDSYCLVYLAGMNCSAFQELNQVTEYFDVNSSQWRSNFAIRGSFESVNAPSGAPIYPPTTVPEPATIGLLAAGLAALRVVGRRRTRQGTRVERAPLQPLRAQAT